MTREGDDPRSPWRCLAVAPLLLLAAVVLLEALVIGSWSRQTGAAYILFVGAAALTALAGFAGYTASHARATRRWIVGYFGAFVAMLLLVVISWTVTDAIRR